MADAKITDLAATAGLADADLIAVVDDVAGTPTNQKSTFTQVWNWIVSKFAALNVAFGTDYAAIGSAPATSGVFRLGSTAGSVDMLGMKYDGGADYMMVRLSAGNFLIGDHSFATQINGNIVQLYSNSSGIALYNTAGSEPWVSIPVGTGGVALATASGAPADWGSGERILFVGNANVVPSTNPTAGVFVYGEGGALKGRGTSGTVTTMAPAEPHCPTCGRDFAIESRNDVVGDHVSVCVPCMLDSLKASGVDTAPFTISDVRKSTRADWQKLRADAARRDAAWAANPASRAKPVAVVFPKPNG